MVLVVVVVVAGDQWNPAASLAGVVPGYLALRLASLANEGEAVCPHIRRNHRALASDSGHVINIMSPSITQSPPGPLRPDLCHIRSEILPLRLEIYLLRPKISPPKP